MENRDATPETGRMQGLRQRIRRLYLLSGLSRLLLAASALLLLSFALDVLLELPLGVRYASGVIALGLLLALSVRTIVYPLSVRISDEDLALAAEARLPLLKDRLISAMQFRRQIEDPDNAESKPMMRAVIAEGESLARAIEVHRLTDARAVGRAGLLGGGAAALLLLSILLFPAAAGVWAKRNLLLRDLAWPRRTTLVVRGFPDSREIVVTRGETVRIEAVAEGRIPKDVRIGYVRLDGEGDEVLRPMYQDEAAPGVFRYEFRQVPDSFRFFVVGGDDTDAEPVYTVLALVPPMIEKFEAYCEFEPYTGKPPETRHEGDLDLPEGTAVTLSLAANMPLRSAAWSRDGGEPEAVEVDAARRVATIRFRVDRTFEYELRLVGEDGQENLPDSASFRIRSEPDRKPQTTVLYPTERETMTPNATVPFRVLSSDDYAVARISLFTRKGADGEFRERRFAPGELAVTEDTKETLAYLRLSLADLSDQEGGPAAGDEYAWFIETEDNHGNTDRSGRYRIEVVSPEDLERRLNQRQGLLREDALDMGRNQSAAQRQTAELLDFLGSEGALEPRDRERVRDDQILQSKVTREMVRFRDSVGRIFLAYVLNRLSSPLTTDKILSILDDEIRTDRKAVSQVFKPSFFRRVVERNAAGDILDDEILSILIGILDDALTVGDDLSPAAWTRLGGIANGRPEVSVPADLNEVYGIQTSIVSTLKALEHKMQRWESYAQIIDLARDLLDLQRDIRMGTEGLQKEK